MFLTKLMFIRQANQKNVIFATIVFFLNKVFKFQPNVWNGCHNLLMVSMNLSNIATLKIKGSDYCCIISEAINLLK